MSPKNSKTDGPHSNQSETEALIWYGFKESSLNKPALQFNERNLIKMIELPNQLTIAEQEKLNDLIRSEKKKYQKKADEKFDTAKNWSIMIEKDCNEERNKIMRRLKFQQMKKHKLVEFKRKEREKIIKERNPAGTTKPSEHDDKTSIGRPSTAATTTNAASQDVAPNLKLMGEEERRRRINSEFMDYVGTFVTKGNTKSLPGKNNNNKEDEQRRRNLAKMKSQGDGAEDFEPEVKDIA